MLTKYMDELALSGRFDLDLNGNVDVYLVELKGFTEDKGLAEWEIVDEGPLPLGWLHYNDASDGALTLFGSWQKFYSQNCDFGQKPIYNGSTILYKDGSPNFGGIAKATIYLRYSRGFNNWLKEIDPQASTVICLERDHFDKLIGDKESNKTRRMPTKWNTFKAPKEKWALPVVCKLSNGKRLVLGLSESVENDWDDIEDLDVDIQRSLELMSFLDTPKVEDKEVISEDFQMGSGLGRNAFGKTYKIDKVSDSEYVRLMGCIPETSRKELLDIWSNKLGYRSNFAPNPDTSELIFLPEGDLSFSELKQFIDDEKQKKTLFFEAKKLKKKANEDVEPKIAVRPNIIPVPASSKATVFLVNIEGGQKKKVIIQQVFPSVCLDYLSSLNEELLHSNTQGNIVGYMKYALTCQDSKTPSVYRYWTTVFTSSLQLNYISANEVFYGFQRFCKAFRGDELIEKGKARDYFWVIAKLRRLQHLIHTARTAPDKLSTLEFNNELKRIEQYKLTTKGVFGMVRQMKDTPNSAELVGNVYDVLREKQKSKLDVFVKQAWQGVPDDDFASFIRGALVGMLLSELTWMVKNEGRSFSVTQGRHPSSLRGEQIQSIITKGVGLLVNLDKQQIFNCKTLPFIKSCTEESRKDTFNSGLIMGLVFIHKSEEKEA